MQQIGRRLHYTLAALDTEYLHAGLYVCMSIHRGYERCNKGLLVLLHATTGMQAGCKSTSSWQFRLCECVHGALKYRCNAGEG